MTDMILDLDTGIDDSIALFLAAVHPSLNLLGVLTSYGNVTTGEAVRNSLDVLFLAGRPDVPVFHGKEKPLAETAPYVPSAVSRRIHGQNGVGGVTLPHSPRRAEKRDGTEWLIEMMKRGRDLVYTATGPLTNLASALLLDPSIASSGVRVVSMGGALTVKGNVTAVAEANIHKDPEAAKIVYESGLDVTAVPLDVTERSRLTESDAEKWISSRTGEGELLGRMLLYYIENTTGGCDTYVHDPSAVIAALHPGYFTSLSTPLTVGTEGEDRGRLYVPVERILERRNRTRALVDVDRTSVERELGRILAYLEKQ